MRPMFIAGLTGILLAIAAIVVLYPSSCVGTDIAIPSGGPDPNDYSCSSVVLNSVGSLDGPTPGTDSRTTGRDVLHRRLVVRAGGVAAVMFLTPILVVGATKKTHRQDRAPRHSDAGGS